MSGLRGQCKHSRCVHTEGHGRPQTEWIRSKPKHAVKDGKDVSPWPGTDPRLTFCSPFGADLLLKSFRLYALLRTFSNISRASQELYTTTFNPQWSCKVLVFAAHFNQPSPERVQQSLHNSTLQNLYEGSSSRLRVCALKYEYNDNIDELNDYLKYLP